MSKLMQKNSRFNGKTGRYYDLKIKFEDISHHRYKLRITVTPPDHHHTLQFSSIIPLFLTDQDRSLQLIISTYLKKSLLYYCILNETSTVP